MRRAGATDFDPDRLAALETRMWKAYYRRQPARLFVTSDRRAARAGHGSRGRGRSPPACCLTRAAAGFARATGDYERFAPDIARGYRLLGLPDHVDAEAVARHELRWWVVRREIGLAAGAAAGESITDLYAALYDVPRERGGGGRPAARARRRGPRPRRDRRPGRSAGCRRAPTGRRSPGCCEPRIAASRPGSAPSCRAGIGSVARGAALRLAVVRAPADEPPGGREERGRDRPA